MRTNPDGLMSAAGMGVMLFNQLQNETSLWETLLAVPQLLSAGSVNQVVDTTEVLLTNIQK